MFHKVKSALKGTRRETVEAVKQKGTEVMNVISEYDLKHCFDQWKTLMERRRDHEEQPTVFGINRLNG